jgi:transposase-like protein
MDVIDSTIKNRKLSELRKDIILAHLCTGKSVAEVARELNINAKHIHDWLKVYEGVERLETSLRDARLILETRLPELIEKALKVLGETLSAPYMSPEKMAAAKLIVNVVTKLSSPKKCPSCDAIRIVN